MAKGKKGGFWSDFKAFITKGNVLDMAVGVVVGGAFGKITSGLVNYIINPIIALLTGGVSLEGLKTGLGEVAQTFTNLEDAVASGLEFVKKGNEYFVYQTYIEWGLWIQTIIDFLIIALSIFTVVRLIKKTEAKLKAKEIAAAAEAAAKKAEEEAAAQQAAAEKAAAQQAIIDEFYQNVKDIHDKLCSK